MRAYFFGNMYLSSIQQGIQSAHVVAEMFTIYNARHLDGTKVNSLYDWAENHKTMILLNAGYSTTIRELVNFFMNVENPYPWAKFNEGQDALDGALTCAGIVLPEKIYEGASTLRSSICGAQILMEEGIINIFQGTDKERVERYTRWEAQLMGKLNTFGLAK